MSLNIPLNWIKKKYTFAVTFKCKVKKGRTLAHIVVSPALDRAVELEGTVIDGTLDHQLAKWGHRGVLYLHIHWPDRNRTSRGKHTTAQTYSRNTLTPTPWVWHSFQTTLGVHNWKFPLPTGSV